MAPSDSEFEEDDIDYSQPLLYDPNEDSGSEFELPIEEQSKKSRKTKDKRGRKPAKQPKSKPAPAKKSRDVGQSRPRPGRSIVLADRTKWTENQIKEAGRKPRDRAPVRLLKKRKASRPLDYEERRHAKRLKSDPDENYRRILNHEINRIAHPTLPKTNIRKTQIGCSVWTRLEKAQFFAAAERVGKHDYPAIAARIGTKSQFEVAEYVDTLENEIQLRKKGVKRYYSLTDDQVPAAIEVSQECCEAMEVFAHDLEKQEQEFKREAEIEKWGSDTWLLTAETDIWMRKDLRAQKSDPDRYQTLVEAVPAVEFFELRNWLSMSRDVFMNPAGESKADQNWRTIVEEDEELEHGIYATAFADFHRLATNLTKKIIASAQFFAQSRTRMYDTDLKKRKKKPCEVTALDVRTAVENMGLPLNTDEFWQKAARRNHLEVVDDANDDEPMSYEEVEQTLNKRLKGTPAERRRRRRRDAREQALLEAHARAEKNAREVREQNEAPGNDDQALLEAHARAEKSAREVREQNANDEEESDSGVSTSDFTDSSDSDSDSDTEMLDADANGTATRQPQKAITALTPEEKYLRYISTLDRLTSIKEEATLWATLHLEAPFDISEAVTEAEHNLSRCKKFLIKRELDPAETDKWRERTEYLAPWESMDGAPKREKWGENEKAMQTVREKERKAVERRERAIAADVFEGFSDEDEGSNDEEIAQVIADREAQALSNERVADSDDESEAPLPSSSQRPDRRQHAHAHKIRSSSPLNLSSDASNEEEMAQVEEYHSMLSQSGSQSQHSNSRSSSSRSQHRNSPRVSSSLYRGLGSPQVPQVASSESGLFDHTGRVRSITPVISATQMDGFLGTQTQRETQQELPGLVEGSVEEDSEEEWLSRGR